MANSDVGQAGATRQKCEDCTLGKPIWFRDGIFGHEWHGNNLIKCLNVYAAQSLAPSTPPTSTAEQSHIHIYRESPECVICGESKLSTPAVSEQEERDRCEEWLKRISVRGPDYNHECVYYMWEHGAREGWLARARSSSPAAAEPRPRIVCLCGSTRFYEYFQRANYEETMAGRIVLSVGFFIHQPKEVWVENAWRTNALQIPDKPAHHEEVGCTAEEKIKLDELHKRKIDLADEVLVLNVGGYIGSSTRSEIDYAIAHNKPVRYLESASPSGGAEGKKEL